MGRAVIVSAVSLLMLSVGVIGQEAPPADKSAPAAAKPPQSDRVPITGVVDTWLKYMHETEHKGYLHERLTPVASHLAHLYRYEYLYEGDVELSVPSAEGGEMQPVSWSWHINAQLEEEFEPYWLEGSVNYGGAQWRFEIRRIGDERVVETTMPATENSPTGEVRQLKLPLSQPIAVLQELLIYRMRQKGELANLGRTVGKVINLVGGYEIPITLKVEESTTRDYMGQKGVFVTPVVVEGGPREYPLPSHVRVYVDRYGRVVEAAGAIDGDRFVIAKDAKEARGGEFVLSARGRRDPFSKKGAMTSKDAAKNETKGAGPAVERPFTVPPGEVPQRLAEMDDLLKSLERYVADSSPQAEPTYQKILRYYEALRKLCAGDPVKLNQLDDHKLRAESLYGGSERLLHRAKSMLDAIEDLYNAVDPKGVETYVAKIKELRMRREFIQDERVLEMDKLIKAAEQKFEQTKARDELRKKHIEVTGAILMEKVVPEHVDLKLTLPGSTLWVQQPVRLVHNITYAVIQVGSGSVLVREGEVIEGQGVVVEKIQPTGIRVSYKGELREVPLRKKSSGPAK